MNEPNHQEEGTSLAGIKLYHPGALATYCVLNAPFGVAVYGVNVLRRGGTIVGSTVSVLGVLLFAGVLVGAVTGNRVSGLGVLGVLVGLSVWAIENRSYQRAMRLAATRARWWPPILVLLGVILVVATIAVFTEP